MSRAPPSHSPFFPQSVISIRTHCSSASLSLLTYSATDPTLCYLLRHHRPGIVALTCTHLRRTDRCDMDHAKSNIPLKGCSMFCMGTLKFSLLPALSTIHLYVFVCTVGLLYLCVRFRFYFERNSFLHFSTCTEGTHDYTDRRPHCIYFCVYGREEVVDVIAQIMLHIYIIEL